MAEPHLGISLEEYVVVSMENTTIGLPRFIETSRVVADDWLSYVVKVEQTFSISFDEEYALAVGSTMRPSMPELHGPVIDAILASFETFPAQVPSRDAHGDSPSPATSIGVRSVTQGTIADPNDLNYFSLDRLAGQTYRVDLELGILVDSFLTLLDASRTCPLTQHNDYGVTLASRLAWTPAETVPNTL